MPNQCSAFNCRSGARGSIPIQMFPFPTAKELQKKWLTKMRVKHWSPSKSSQLCIKHFTEDQLVPKQNDLTSRGKPKKKRTLIPNAVPSIFRFKSGGKHNLSSPSPNMLKTGMSIGQAAPAPSTPILTPNPSAYQKYYHRPATGLRTESQRPLPDSFYTNSDIFPQSQLERRPEAAPPLKVNNARVDLDEGQLVEKKTVSFQDTAIIALKLSQSILNLYKTVSPYLN